MRLSKYGKLLVPILIVFKIDLRAFFSLSLVLSLILKRSRWRSQRMAINQTANVESPAKLSEPQLSPHTIHSCPRKPIISSDDSLRTPQNMSSMCGDTQVGSPSPLYTVMKLFQTKTRFWTLLKSVSTYLPTASLQVEESGLWISFPFWNIFHYGCLVPVSRKMR